MTQEGIGERGTDLNGTYLTANRLIGLQKNKKRPPSVYGDSCEKVSGIKDYTQPHLRNCMTDIPSIPTQSSREFIL